MPIYIKAGAKEADVWVDNIMDRFYFAFMFIVFGKFKTNFERRVKEQDGQNG